MKKKKKIKQIDIAIMYITPYGDEVRVIKTTDYEMAKDYLLKEEPKNYDTDLRNLEFTFDGREGGACFYSYKDLHFIFINPFKDKVRNIGQIVHECMHVTNKILYRRGLLLTPDSEEAYTYMIQHLVQEILPMFKK